MLTMRRTLSPKRQREVEELARNLLGQSSRITPYDLAASAKIDFFHARAVLRLLANRGHAREFPGGSFGQSLVGKIREEETASARRDRAHAARKP
jgi:hypothetical protein